MSTSHQRSSSSVKRTGKAAASSAVPPQTPAPLPTANDRDEWCAHWQAQGQPWRTEPEINQHRQAELTQRRTITPDIEQGIYPFKGMKLDRADIEWLLATHENGSGPVDWSDEGQRVREGLDIRGAELQDVNLSGLPLAKLRSGVRYRERLFATRAQRLMATVHLLIST